MTAPGAGGPAGGGDGLGLLRGAVWAYLVLLLYEGALRKWVAPGLSNALLIVRDPVLLVIYALAFARGVFPLNAFVLASVLLGGSALAVSLLFADIPAQVSLFGWRATYLHLPLIFVIPACCGREDVIRYGRLVLWTALPMAVIVYFQFRTPVDSWWNRGAGGGEAMKSAFDRARASGTFSFATGLASYAGLLAAFLVWATMEGGRERFARWLLWAGWAALAAILMLSASRSVILGALVVMAGAAGLAVTRPRYLPAVLGGAVGAGLIYLGLSQFDVFAAGLETHAYRFGAAGAHEGSTFLRLVRTITPPLHLMSGVPVFGYGLGLGTNAGAALIWGRPLFLLSEGELGRLVFESGPLLGFATIGLRYGVAAAVGRSAWKATGHGNVLPWLFFCAGFLGLVAGQWGQATALGFGVVLPGLALASLRTRAAAPEDEDEGEEDGEDGEEDEEEEEEGAGAAGRRVPPEPAVPGGGRAS